MSGSLDEATTTTEVRVRILGLSCSNCDFHYDVTLPYHQPLVPRSYLHDWTWEHVDCGGQISWATAQEEPLTLEMLGALMDALQNGANPVRGIPALVLEQLRRHRIGEGAL
jgi:hypothetical protein